MPIHILIPIALIAFGASAVQSTTGFGFGIFAMIFLPSVLSFTEANVLSTMLSALTSVWTAALLFKKINFKNLTFPLAGCLVTTWLSVEFIKAQSNHVLTLLLGAALLILSLYFFFFSDRIRIKPTWYAGLIAGIISGIMGGMFSIGGPPVVIYYMQSERDTDSYLATISAYFVLSGITTVLTKAVAGFVTLNVLLALVVGCIGMAFGCLAGRVLRDRINPTMLKRGVYGVMAISGVINIVSSVIALL